MGDYWFSLEIKDEVARKMKRKEYYAARSYLGKVRRIMAARTEDAVTPEVINDLVIYGSAKVAFTTKDAK